MATNIEDESFDETINKLQILTAISPESATVSSTSASRENPFKIVPSALENIRDHEAVVKEIFGTHCECGAERTLTVSVPLATNLGKGCGIGGKQNGGINLEHGILNPTPFKHKVRGDKKIIVRESVLKNIGKCVHRSMVQQSEIAKEIINQNQQLITSSAFQPTTNLLKPSLSENNLTKCFSNSSSDDILDFRLLVSQCSELTLSSSSTSKTLDRPNFSQSSFKALRQQPDFFSCQNNRSALPRRNRRVRYLKRSNSTSSLESDSSSTSSMAPFGSLTAVIPGTVASTFTGAQIQQQQNQSSQQQSSQSSSPSSSSSASCSTQARLNSTMPCDITIDEMASYFETLVHIPKKMSSMAEMMYI
ncbi:uncharacterized protein LOC129725046 [Wyeomyia smithii]|uniref:uncharacterized protein LOC129725046 n=1 Tax=Wyeomyia smithii TaxID=174621 RepID=UPI00246820CE|nr:uncharacterized protein LOC129725046 [Wyeomyia smithii]XP_055536418.1 uncharacterized protein LOC129725046 [Wyeomyia smithii]XP_055536419.1 uncharacterized protein LOC129725046 [Wyeomyia smithii]